MYYWTGSALITAGSGRLGRAVHLGVNLAMEETSEKSQHYRASTLGKALNEALAELK